jgi:hypothetical protein
VGSQILLSNSNFNPMAVKVRFKQWNCVVKLTHYRDQRPALILRHEFTGEDILVASVNLPDVPLRNDEILIKDWSENEGVLQLLMDNGVIGPVIENVPTGMVSAQKCKLLIPKT